MAVQASCTAFTRTLRQPRCGCCGVLRYKPASTGPAIGKGVQAGTTDQFRVHRLLPTMLALRRLMLDSEAKELERRLDKARQCLRRAPPVDLHAAARGDGSGEGREREAKFRVVEAGGEDAREPAGKFSSYKIRKVLIFTVILTAPVPYSSVKGVLARLELYHNTVWHLQKKISNFLPGGLMSGACWNTCSRGKGCLVKAWTLKAKSEKIGAASIIRGFSTQVPREESVLAAARSDIQRSWKGCSNWCLFLLEEVAPLAGNSTSTTHAILAVNATHEHELYQQRIASVPRLSVGGKHAQLIRRSKKSRPGVSPSPAGDGGDYELSARQPRGPERRIARSSLFRLRLQTSPAAEHTNIWCQYPVGVTFATLVRPQRDWFGVWFRLGILLARSIHECIFPSLQGPIAKVRTPPNVHRPSNDDNDGPRHGAPNVLASWKHTADPRWKAEYRLNSNHVTDHLPRVPQKLSAMHVVAT
ncbi:hypothetical protein FA13DRAFT_1722429 [Coprinellus micaceus]|uniref:Uncharacterized protein n=1 Tax=Coprinellus micaceus TaxID=71717 RepID=A0A4Y7RLU1_COPMI|nr:hypothetical protein FA13DRAFT_1722429 [Coprinellus micaceus]